MLVSVHEDKDVKRRLSLLCMNRNTEAETRVLPHASHLLNTSTVHMSILNVTFPDFYSNFLSLLDQLLANWLISAV